MTIKDLSVAVPPKAKKKNYSKQYHGETLSDPYHWLRDPAYPEVNDPEILAHIRAENEYCEAVFAPLKPLKEKIFAELKARVVQEDKSVPAKWGQYYYYWQYEKGADYRCWYRTPLAGGDPALILDEAARAKTADGSYYNMRAFDVSTTEGHLLWSEDINGSERYRILVRDLEGGSLMGPVVENTSGVALWVRDQMAFIYVELNDQLRPYRVKLHRMGSPTQDDKILFEEEDPAFYVSISKTLSGEYFLIRSGDHVTSEIQIVYTNEPDRDPLILSRRKTGHDYQVSHSGDFFYILTNDVHKNFRLVKAPVKTPSEKNWVEIIAASDNMYMQNIQAFQNFLIVEGRVSGEDFLSVLDLKNAKSHIIALPEQNACVQIDENRDFAAEKIRIRYESMITPPTIYDYDPKARKLFQQKTQIIPSGYESSHYQTLKIWATAADNTKIPVNIVYATKYMPSSARALHLYAYGAYGLGISPRFSASRLSLLDRGVIYAIAHVRGGDELGYSWYEDGKLSKRTNSFEDFIAVADHLVAEGICGEGQISISGGSAGGSLIGYVLNRRPQAWKAAVAHVPFVDILNTMLDDQLPLTPMEWPEWGNPILDRNAYETIRSYSPYDNIQAQNYPQIFVTAGLHDPRVTYWEPLKWVAKLRDKNKSAYTITLKTHLGAGHQGASGRFDYLEEIADEYAFILNAFGKAS